MLTGWPQTDQRVPREVSKKIFIDVMQFSDKWRVGFHPMTVTSQAKGLEKVHWPVKPDKMFTDVI